MADCRTDCARYELFDHRDFCGDMQIHGCPDDCREYKKTKPYVSEKEQTLSQIIEQRAQEIERLKVENNRLRVCCNCRHFEWPKCTVSGKRTTRASICRDWEMV